MVRLYHRYRVEKMGLIEEPIIIIKAEPLTALIYTVMNQYNANPKMKIAQNVTLARLPPQPPK